MESESNLKKRLLISISIFILALLLLSDVVFAAEESANHTHKVPKATPIPTPTPTPAPTTVPTQEPTPIPTTTPIPTATPVINTASNDTMIITDVYGIYNQNNNRSFSFVSFILGMLTMFGLVIILRLVVINYNNRARYGRSYNRTSRGYPVTRNRY